METNLILPSAKETLLAKIKKNKREVSAKLSFHRLAYEYSLQYLADKWFCAGSISLEKEELRVLEELVYKKALMCFVFFCPAYLVNYYWERFCGCSWYDVVGVYNFLRSRRYIKKYDIAQVNKAKGS